MGRGEKMEIKVDDRSKYRCDHWQGFAARVLEHLAAKNYLPETIAHFAITDKAVPDDGKMHILLGTDRWEIPGAIDDQEDNQRAQALIGKKYLRVWGIPECPGEREVENTKRLLDRLLPQVWERDPVKLAALIRAGEEAERIRSRAAYVTECAKRFEKTVTGTKKAITDGYAAIAKLQDDLVKKIREVKGCERKLEQLETCKPAEAEKYGQEFDKLLQVPKVKRVEAKEGKVIVYTDVLFCADPRTGKRHEIGAFRIELSVDSGMPRWFNLTRKVRGYRANQMAPHIWEDGTACLGNTAEVFPELMGSYEFAAAAMVAIQFVESVNTDDAAGKNVSNWPEAPAEEVVHV